MKNKTKILKSILIGSFMLSSALVFNTKNTYAQAKWTAPTSAKSLKNPLSGDVEATREGKKLYISTCSPCHGERGKGDGAAAAALNPKPANHSSAIVQSQTDGEIFWKLNEGRGAMAAYKNQFNEKQRWSLVNYIRTLKK